jgi:hypothetical protein
MDDTSMPFTPYIRSPLLNLIPEKIPPPPPPPPEEEDGQTTTRTTPFDDGDPSSSNASPSTTTATTAEFSSAVDDDDDDDDEYPDLISLIERIIPAARGGLHASRYIDPRGLSPREARMLTWYGR